MTVYDRYFRSPVLYDYLLSGIVVILVNSAVSYGKLVIPKTDLLYSMVSDLATVSLTLSGFLLTLITVLISFKSTSKVDPNDVKESDTVFDIFFATSLYFETIRHLRSGMISLVIVAVSGYILKLSVSDAHTNYLFLFNLGGLCVVVLTLARGVTILSQIVKMQKDN